MKYVIECTPEQLRFIKEILSEDASRADVKFWESPICIALGEARPLSELCEEEAKRYDTKHCEHFSNGETQSAAESAIIAGAFRRFNAGL